MMMSAFSSITALIFFHVFCFDIVFLDENKLLSIPVKLCHAVITLDMDVNRLMLFAIKEERKARKRKISGIIMILYNDFGHKDRNYF